MSGMNLLDWIMDYLLPIFIDSETLATAQVANMSIRDFVAMWLVVLLVGMPTLAIYLAIKRGRRLL